MSPEKSERANGLSQSQKACDGSQLFQKVNKANHN